MRGAIRSVLEKKTLLGAVSVTLGSLLFGQPTIAGIAGAMALSEASLEIGKAAIEIANNRHAFHKIKRDHKLAFIIETKQKLEL